MKECSGFCLDVFRSFVWIYSWPGCRSRILLYTPRSNLFILNRVTGLNEYRNVSYLCWACLNIHVCIFNLVSVQVIDPLVIGTENQTIQRSSYRFLTICGLTVTIWSFYCMEDPRWQIDALRKLNKFLFLPSIRLSWLTNTFTLHNKTEQYVQHYVRQVYV